MAELPPVLNLPPPPVGTTNNALFLCGFTVAESESLVNDAFPDFAAFTRMKEKDVITLAEDWKKRTPVANRIIFGFARAKTLQGLMHWVQDMQRTQKDPATQVVTRETFHTALDNATIRENMADNMDTASKAADPGKLKANTDWYIWSQGFTNYLSTIPGCTGIPLSYVVRQEEDTPEDYIFAVDTDYLTQLSDYAALAGPAFVADRRQVHQLLLGKILGEEAEEWIRDDKSKQNGRIDFNRLKTHYEGDGNISRRIATAEQIQKTLFYKQERSMKFTVFLAKLQFMFQIFKHEDEEMSESAKIRHLLDRVQSPYLSQMVTNLQFQYGEGHLTYDAAKNALLTAVAKSPDYIANDQRKVMAVGQGNHKWNKYQKDGSGGKKPPYKKKQHSGAVPKGDEKIDNDTWRGLSREQQRVIRKYRDDNNLPGGNKHKVSSVSSTLAPADIDRIVAAIDARSPNNVSTVSSVTGSAGQAFGGRSEAAQRKN